MPLRRCMNVGRVTSCPASPRVSCTLAYHAAAVASIRKDDRLPEKVASLADIN